MYKFIEKNNLTVYDYCLIYYYLNNKDEENKINKEQFIELIDNLSLNKIDSKFEQIIVGGLFLRFSLRNDNKPYSLTEFIEKTANLIPNFVISTSKASYFLNNSKDYCRKEINNRAHFSYIGNAKERIPDLCEEINKYIVMYDFNIDNVNSIKSFMGLEDKSIDEIIKDLEKKNKYKDMDAPYSICDKQSLIKYLKEVIEVESDIYSLQSRYLSLEKQLEQISYVGLFIEPYNHILNRAEIIKKERKELNDYCNSKPTFDMFINTIKLDKPKFNYVEPMKPELKKSGIFNKKRIEQENEDLLRNYEIELSKYVSAKKEYDKALITYEEEREKLNASAKLKYQLALDTFEKEYNRKQELINQKQNELNSIKEQSIDDLLNNNNEKFEQAKKIAYEMNFVVNCLDKEIKLLEQLFSYNIVYGKYRNYIALSSMLDYLLSGRCDVLEGNAGAYNLYEQESRSDIIINKMDVIIDKLDTISKSQYYLYSKLCEINDSLIEINNLLLINNVLQAGELFQLSNISYKTCEIAYNTNQIASNTKEIAYNTKVASFYAEKTAHYTEALAYLKLLNG